MATNSFLQNIFYLKKSNYFLQVTNILQNIFVCVQQMKQLESE